MIWYEALPGDGHLGYILSFPFQYHWCRLTCWWQPKKCRSNVFVWR